MWKDKSDQYEKVAIHRLPLHVGQLKCVERIEVTVNGRATNKAKEYFCTFVRKRAKECCDRLEEDDYLLLRSDPKNLLDKNIIPRYWDLRFNARAALYLCKRDGIDSNERNLSLGDSDKFELHYECEYDIQNV